jgi:hypothetical protein
MSVLFIENVNSQEIPTASDSTKLYENIQSYSKRNKLTGFVYGMIFKPVEGFSPKKTPRKKVNKNLIRKPYSAFEGKIIRNISIESLDPFGYSIANPLGEPENFFLRTGNKLHIKTRDITIRNLLLIHQNQVFDSLLVKESERLVRSMGYIRDVSIRVYPVSKYSDSVDIIIRALDNWSIIPGASFSDTKMSIDILDRNFGGLGHEFQNGLAKYKTTGNYGFSTNYFIPNIKNTYINSTLNYRTDEFNNYSRNFAVDRPFFSPFAKWAAGVNFKQEFRSDSLMSADSIFIDQRFKFNTQDYWAGYAVQIFKGNTENDRTTNFISAFRILRIRYLENPDEVLDPLHVFSGENFYLFSFGISTRKYFQDKFIFKYGITEDVPIGKVISVTGGYQVKNNIGRPYFAARFSIGNNYQKGYLSSNFEYGTFFHSSRPEQGVFSAGINYFTPLLEIGKWKFRQFVKPQITIGLLQFNNDSLTLNDGFGLDGFRSKELSGTSRVLLTLQSQAYTPWNFLGFRFGPYFILSLGRLGKSSTAFKNSRLYSQTGFGVLIKNDNLIINTFQISIAFYPSIPGMGEDIFKFNSYKTTEFGFRDFEIGKPGTIIFR